MTQFSGRNDLDVHNRLSRRSFIQIAGAATFGIAAASALGCAPTTEMAGTGESEAPAEEYDMVIVGAGGAGLSAAVTAAEQGKRVALLEKLPMTGGTYALSHLETIALDEGTGEFYDAEELFDYWMDQTEGACNEGLMRKVTSQINDTLSWLEAMGCKMYTTGNTRPDAPAPIAFKSPSETGELASGAGGMASSVMVERFEELGGTLITEAVVQSLIADDGAIIGAVASVDGEQRSFMAPVTILAAGSFESGIGGEGNPVIDEYEGNTGDGIMMGREVGASVEFHIPYVRGRMMCGGAADAQIGATSVLVNGDMKRVGNEAGLFRDLYNAAVEDGGNEELYALIGQDNMPKDPSKFEGNEGFVSGGNVDELADAMGVDATALAEAIERYNGFAAAGVDGDFQKPAESLVAIDGDTLYAEKVMLLVGGCIGGLAVDDCCRVLAEDGSTIPGLYSAGDTCNRSFHGGFYLGSGSNTCFAMNSGRIAAREAIADLL